MKKTSQTSKWFAITAFLLFVGLALFPAVQSNDIAASIEIKSTGNTIYVDDDGGGDYTNIQDAINASSEGDTIYVYSGTYVAKTTQNCDVYSQRCEIIINVNNLKIIGLSYDSPVGNDEGLPIITNKYSDTNDAILFLVISNKNNILISDCSFQSLSSRPIYGIIIDDSEDVVITNCSFSFNDTFGYGVSMHDKSKRVTILNCSFYKCGYGISCTWADRPGYAADIINCEFTECNLGIELDDNSGSIISNCKISQCNYGIRCHEWIIYDGKTPFTDISDCEITECNTGIFMFDCTRSTITNSKISECDRGIELIRNSSYNTIEKNTISSCNTGLIMYYFNNKSCPLYNKIENNTFLENMYHAYHENSIDYLILDGGLLLGIIFKGWTRIIIDWVIDKKINHNIIAKEILKSNYFDNNYWEGITSSSVAIPIEMKFLTRHNSFRGGCTYNERFRIKTKDPDISADHNPRSKPYADS